MPPHTCLSPCCAAVIRGNADVSLKSVSEEACYHAKGRLGAEPLRLVAQALAEQASPSPTFFGLIPCAADGSNMDVPNFPEVEAEFGRPPSSRGMTGYPQTKGVTLIYADTHQVKDAVWGTWKLSELSAIETMIDRDSLGNEHVLFLDRRYTKVDLWFLLLQREIHFVHRLSASYHPKKRECQGPGDWLIDVGRWIPIPPEERTGRQKRRWESRVLRLIEYQIGKEEKVQLLTDLLDPQLYPAQEIALGYHLRWESEISYDEIKTHLSTVKHGTQHTIFRSHSSDGIYQEAWGLIAAYNLVRGLMVQAGEVRNIPPLEISFVGALQVIDRTWPTLEACTEENRDMLMKRMLNDIADCRIDRPRRNRWSPRVIRKKISNFKCKKEQDRSKPRDYAAELKLLG